MREGGGGGCGKNGNRQHSTSGAASNILRVEHEHLHCRDIQPLRDENNCRTTLRAYWKRCIKQSTSVACTVKAAGVGEAAARMTQTEPQKFSSRAQPQQHQQKGVVPDQHPMLSRVVQQCKYRQGGQETHTPASFSAAVFLPPSAKAVRQVCRKSEALSPADGNSDKGCNLNIVTCGRVAKEEERLGDKS